MHWKAASAELTKPLDSSKVKKPTGQFGPKGDYLEGWHVINEANRIFGFDGWSYIIDLTRDDLREGIDSKNKPQWQAAYTCVCTVNVAGVVRQDVGFGSGFAKSIGDAIEGATKEAVTDALKRCLRTFGNPFGLALYDKSRANVADIPEPEDESVTKARAAYNAAVDGFTTAADLGNWWRDTRAEIAEMLGEEEAKAIKARVVARGNELSPPARRAA